MMIMRFHKLIQSKLLWLVFLGILVCTFVFWGVASNMDSANPALSRLNDTYALVDGRKVTWLEFDQTRRLLTRMNDMPGEALEEASLNRLAMLAYAKDLGIQAPIQLARQRFAMNFTNAEGEIDPEMLEGFRQSLRGGSLTEDEFVKFIRDDMILQDLQQVLSTHVLVAPADVEKLGRLQTDRFDLVYATLDTDRLEEEVEVSEDQLADYYREFKSRYEIPEQRRVSYIQVPLDAFMDDIEPVTEEDARAHYQSRPEQYMRSVEKPAETGDGETETVREPIPFEEVREQIVPELRRQRAMEKARETAMTYAVRLTPRRGRRGEPLEELAARENLDLRRAGPFSRRDPLPDIKNAAAFKQTAFELDESPIGRVGGPVLTGDRMTVIQLEDIVPPRVPELEEVEDTVRPDAANHYRQAALSRLATHLVEEIRVKLREGAEFSAVAEELKLELTDPEPFQPRDLNRNMPSIPRPLVEEATGHAEGEVFGPVDNPFFGGQLIGYLQSREPMPEDLAEISPMMRDMLASRFVFQGFSNRFQELVLADMIEKVEKDDAPGEIPQEPGE